MTLSSQTCIVMDLEELEKLSKLQLMCCMRPPFFSKASIYLRVLIYVCIITFTCLITYLPVFSRNNGGSCQFTTIEISKYKSYTSKMTTNLNPAHYTCIVLTIMWQVRSKPLVNFFIASAASQSKKLKFVCLSVSLSVLTK